MGNYKYKFSHLYTVTVDFLQFSLQFLSAHAQLFFCHELCSYVLCSSYHRGHLWEREGAGGMGMEATRKGAWPVCILGQRLLLPASSEPLALTGSAILDSAAGHLELGRRGIRASLPLPRRAASGFSFC